MLLFCLCNDWFVLNNVDLYILFYNVVCITINVSIFPPTMMTQMHQAYDNRYNNLIAICIFLIFFNFVQQLLCIIIYYRFLPIVLQNFFRVLRVIFLFILIYLATHFLQRQTKGFFMSKWPFKKKDIVCEFNFNYFISYSTNGI